VAVNEFWTPFLTGGGTRPDAISGLNPAFRDSLAALLMAAPEDIRAGIQILSAYRSPEIQAQLYQSALQRYGSEAEAQRWVAPPGNSRHNSGLAVDFSWGNPAAQAWVHENAANHGLHFPMSWENWHIEPIGPDGGRVPMDGTWAGMPGGAGGVASALGGALGGTPDGLAAAEAELAALLSAPRPSVSTRPTRRATSAPSAFEPPPPTAAETAETANRNASSLPALLDEIQMSLAAPQARARRMLA
jgi:hypothetical protein